MKTVQEVMAMCDKRKVVAAYIILCNEMLNKKTICRLDQLMDELQERKIEPSKENIVISEFNYKNRRVRFESYVASVRDIMDYFRIFDFFEEYIDKEPQELELLLGPAAVMSLDKKLDLIYELGKNYDTDSYPGHIETYAYEFEPWNTILGYLVPDHIIGSFNMETYIGAVLYEMTFFGFFEEEVQDTRDEYAYRNSLVEENLKALTKEEFYQKYACSFDDFNKELISTFDIEMVEEEEEDKQTRFKNYIIRSILNYQEMKKTYEDLLKTDHES